MRIRINSNNDIHVDWFSYLYLFMIVIYAGQSRGSVMGLVGFDGNYIGFFIPIIMTVFLLNREKVHFSNSNFIKALVILTIWFVIQFIVRHGQLNITLTLFHYYQLILCFIIIQVFREKLFSVYEDIVYKLAVFSLIMWGMSIIMPSVVAGFMHLFRNPTEISEGSFLVYTMMSLSRVDGVIRNAGFAWEPGRYACFLCLAIYCNLLLNRFSMKNNKKIWILLIALLSTQSTTGIFTLFVIMLWFVLNRNLKHKFFYLIVLVPLIVFLFNQEYAGEKLLKNIEKSETIMDQSDKEGVGLDRMESFVVEWHNFLHDPVIGYGEWRHSYVEKNVFQGAFVNNGNMHILAMYGVLGVLYYICIILSSVRIGVFFGDKTKIGYLLVFLGITMGYVFNNIVLVMAFSFWGVFVPKETLACSLYKKQ